MRDARTTAIPSLTRIEAVHVRVPFRRPLLDTTGEYTHRHSWLLRLVDAQGREGVGEAVLDPFADEQALGSLARLIREVVPQLLGGDHATVEGLAAEQLAAEGPFGRAVSAGIEGALGALEASSSASGAPAQAVPVCAVIGFGGPDAAAEAAAQAVELGFGTLEIRAGYERTTDQLVERLQALRAAVGPEPRIRVDAGAAWSLDVATERLAAIAPFRVELVEQPLAAWDLTGHAALRERVQIPIALDEAVDSEGAARAALAEGAADFLVVKPARVGGGGAVARIADSARAAGAGVILATYFETGIGIASTLRIAAALPGASGIAHGVATAGLLVHDLLATPLPIARGRMPAPGTIALDEAEVARSTVERFEVARG